MFRANNFYFHRIITTSNTERFSVKSQAARLQVFKADDSLQFPVKRELKHATLLSHDVNRKGTFHTSGQWSPPDLSN